MSLFFLSNAQKRRSSGGKLRSCQRSAWHGAPTARDSQTDVIAPLPEAAWLGRFMIKS